MKPAFFAADAEGRVRALPRIALGMAALIGLWPSVCESATTPSRETPLWDPVERYESRQMEGWTVRVNQQLLAQEPLARDTLRLLEFQLYQIVRVVPPNALTKLRTIPIWVELAHPRHPCMCYHPSADWLRDHDMNPAKAGGVEIANATNFLAWTKLQPWMVLHELAHGYHHLTLGHGHPEVKAAYEKAKAANAGRDPDQEQIIAAFRGLTFATPSGATQMTLGNGHQGIQGIAYGQTRLVGGKVTITNIRRYGAEQVNPPDGVKSVDWIATALRQH